MPSIRDLNISSVSLGTSPGGDSARLASDRRLPSPILALLAAVAMAVVVLIAVQPTWAQDMTIEYAENGMDPVANFTADDPEGVTPITWSLLASTAPNPTGVDADVDSADSNHFDINKDGELTFDVGGDDDTPDNSVSPDFENPPASNATDNTYKVVVVASDAETGGQMGYHKVTVKVTNMAENGKVSWTVDPDGGATHVAATPKLTQFQAGASLMVSVSDGDIAGENKTVEAARTDVAADPTWRWYRSPNMTDMGTMIDGATSATYTVTTDDVGMYLRAVTYYLVTGNVDQETASLTSDYPVLAARPADKANELKFDPAAVSRNVAESDKGANVGAPVTATGNHGAVNYTLGNTTNGVDNDKFKVDQKTGQITTLVDLNYDSTAAAADNCTALNSCVVTVRATDASGDATAETAVADPPTFVDATVTIKITDVDEKPTFSSGDKAVSVEEGTTVVDSNSDIDGDSATGESVYTAADPEGLSLTYHLMGPDGARFELSNARVLSFRMKPDYENPTDADGDNVYEVTVRASDGTTNGDRMVKVTVTGMDEAPEIMGRDSVNYVENGTGPVATFTADDPEGVTPITWSLLDTGTPGDIIAADYADENHFDIDKNGVLTFDVGGDDDTPDNSVSPDFENPPTSNAIDNTYRVVVVASDAATAGQMGYHKVTVKVTNMAETGKVTWTVDHDGGGADEPKLIQFQVGAVLSASVTDGDIAGDVKTVAAARDDVAADPTWRWYRGSSLISNQQAPTYTVTSTDIGSRIRVVATYRVGDSTTQESASLISDYPVLAARPADKDNELKFDPVAISRSVAEGDKGANVGAPITATGNHGAVNYTLADATSGDNAKFKIDQKSGQITTLVDLNYDSAAAAADNCATLNSCTVTIRATDASGSATAVTANTANNVFADATVTIKITDVDEKPTFSTGDKAVSVEEGMTVVDSDSDGDSTSNTGESVYAASDPEGLNVNLSLMGPDAAKFTRSSDSVLSFRMKPDYEMPTDADGDNVYEVTVRASDGTMHEDRMVKVTVTNMNEPPTITLVPGSNVAPMFASSTADRSVEENTARGQDIGAPVMATDRNGDDLTYRLSGTDSGYFRIDRDSGQLMTYAVLDYETKMSYMVTVTATDPGGESASINVTIMVTDVDDAGQPSTLIQRYDANENDSIEKSEVISAINDYLDAGNDAPTKADVIALINRYLDS